MIDCGHNSTTGWRPGDALVEAGLYSLDRLIISNYDEDHVSAYPNLVERVNVRAITRNWHVAPSIIRKLKSEQGIGAGIERLVSTLEQTFTGKCIVREALLVLHAVARHYFTLKIVVFSR
jgi:hypothetical protein